MGVARCEKGRTWRVFKSLFKRQKEKERGGDHLKEGTKVQKYNYFCKTFQDCPFKNKLDF